MTLYMSRKTLAEALDCAESTVDEMVKRGIIPAPKQLSTGCVRFRWADVDAALQALNHGGPAANDTGVRNARQAPEGRRDAS
jgi:predicted DNA-binding transcriptional regulator AlpA